VAAAQAQPAQTQQTAQAQPFYWWRSDEFKKELGLTSEQEARIDNVHQSTLPELRQEFAELERMEAKFAKLLDASDDEALLARQIDRVETARAQLNKTRQLMFARFRLILTREQRARFTQLWEARRPNNRRPAGSPNSSDTREK
jgi:Spy/CpxP family protein refolding chaperone